MGKRSTKVRWPPKINVLQITDCHLKGSVDARLIGVDTADSLAHVLDAALDRATPDLLLVTGDIAHDPEPATYERFLNLVRERYSGRLVGVPGNHDLGGAMPALLNCPSPVALGGWHVVTMDTHVDDEVGGQLSDVALERLRAEVAGLDGWICLAGHHPPVTVGAPWLDKDRLDNYRAVLEWVAAADKIRAWVFGHVHQAVDQQHRGCRLLGCPSTCFQFAPNTERFAIDEQAPGYRWLELQPDGGVDTTLERLEGYTIRVDLKGTTV